MNVVTKLRTDERLTPGLLFVVVSSVYFMTVTGITASNDGSHYAAARAFAEEGGFDIAPYLAFTEELDHAIDQRGVVHSDRPAGIGVVTSVFYRLGQLAPEPLVQVPSKHDANNPLVIYAVLAAVLAGTATVLLFYAILRQHFEVSAGASLLAALTFAFATLTWKYSTTLYSHSFSSASLFLALYLMLRAERRGAFDWREAFLLGFALGASVLFEYTNAMLVAVALVYLALTWGRPVYDALRDPSARRSWLGTLGAAALGSLLPFGFFVAYNAALFGGPFRLSAYYVDPVRWACCVTLAGNFQHPIFDGIKSFLVSGNDIRGLFLLTPVSILALFGWRALFRHSRRDFALILGTFAVFLALFSMGSTINPNTDDGRYLTPFVGLWFIPFGLWLDRTVFRVRDGVLRALVWLLFAGLLLLSVRNVAVHITRSWGYELDLTGFDYHNLSPSNLGRFGSALFPNAPNLPLLWLLEGAALALGLGFAWARRGLAPRRRPVLDAAAVLVVVGYALAPAVGALRDAQPPGMTYLDQPFGDNLRLVGYQLSRWDADFEPGDPVRVRLYWELDAPAEEPLDVRLALLDEDGAVWSETESELGRATFRQIPVTTWPAGRVVQEEYSLPFDAAPPFGLATDLLVTVAGETATVLRLRPATLMPAEPPSHALDYQFEDVAHLTGCDVESLPHHRLAVTLHWEVTGGTSVPYTTFVHVVSPGGELVAQGDSQPFAGEYPTTDWQPGETLADTYVLELDRAFRPGGYSLRVGLYNPEGGARLPVADADGLPVYDSVVIVEGVTLP